MPDEVMLDLSGLERILREEPQLVEEWLDGVAQEMTNDVVESFGTSPPGLAYPRGQRVHIASQPGYPPNVDLGTLRASIHWERTGQLERQIMDGVDYGIDLEDVKNRPFMGPVFHDWRHKIDDDARRHLEIE